MKLQATRKNKEVINCVQGKIPWRKRIYLESRLVWKIISPPLPRVRKTFAQKDGIDKGSSCLSAESGENESRRERGRMQAVE